MAKRDEWGNLGLFQQIPANLQFGAGGWDSGLLERPPAAAGQDRSIMRLVMGDMEESMGLSKLLTNPNFHGGGGIADQGYVSDQIGAGLMMNDAINLPQNPIFFPYLPRFISGFHSRACRSSTCWAGVGIHRTAHSPRPRRPSQGHRRRTPHGLLRRMVIGESGMVNGKVTKVKRRGNIVISVGLNGNLDEKHGKW